MYLFLCLVCCLSLTEPEVVRNLTVIDFTTTSVYLKWTEPEGFTLFYTVVWTNNASSQSLIVKNTQINIPELTPGVQCNFSVTAVAGDNVTKGEATTVSLYTSKIYVGLLTINTHELF